MVAVVLWSWRFLISRTYWGLGICLGRLCGCIAGIRPGHYFYLVFLGGNQPFSFLCNFGYLPNLGIGVGWGGLNWLGCGWVFGSNFPSSSRHVFISLMMVGWGSSLVFYGLHLIIWQVLSHLIIWVPCIDVVITSTSTISTGKHHLKKLCKKLHSGCRMQVIWKWKVGSISTLI